MQDDNFSAQSQLFEPDSSEPAGSLRRALYLWERQPPAPPRLNPAEHAVKTPPDVTPKSDLQEPDAVSAFKISEPADSAIEERLKRHAARLSALERIIPGDRRLDPPRFSLMMLNAFLGRAVSDSAVLARLPGLFSISDRIDGELADLELEYPDALGEPKTESDPSLSLLRDQIQQLFADFKSGQKAQQRQLLASLAAIHTALHEIRAHLPDRAEPPENRPPSAEPDAAPLMPKAISDDFAQPLIDRERLVDPRPVLAAARAAASRANLELADLVQDGADDGRSGQSGKRPYRSVLLGSAFLGALMILFGRDAVQFFSASVTHSGLARP